MEEKRKKCNFAFFQGISDVGKPESTILKMKEQIKKSSSVGAEFIIFPELFLSGYHVPAEQMKSLAEEKNGPSFQELSKTAKESNIAVLYGYPEVDRSSSSAVFYNSAQLIDKNGSSLVNYRKTHLWIDEYGYEKVFQPGNILEEVVECRGVKIGILICFDVEFPECVRALMLKGAQLIAVPTAIPYHKFKFVAHTIIPCRANENGVWIAYVNSAGTLSGHSVCCDVDGEVTVMAGGEEQLVLFSVDPSMIPKCDYRGKRRPDLYCK